MESDTSHTKSELFKQRSELTFLERPSWIVPPSPRAIYHRSTSSGQQNEHEWRMKLFKTRSWTGMWWVRTSVSEESLRAPSLTLFWRPSGGERKRSRGFSCHFKTSEWWPSWGLGQHRASFHGRISEQEPRCQGANHAPSRCHSITASTRRYGVHRKENFVSACVLPLFVYNSFISKDAWLLRADFVLLRLPSHWL